jgi:hypothetical protein
MEDYERHFLSWRQGLLCAIKIVQPVTEPLQASYERIRAGARAASLKRNLPVVLCAHAPFHAGVDPRLRRPHTHVLLLTSTLSLLGWGPPNDEVTCDAGHLTLYEEFKAAGALP